MGLKTISWYLLLWISNSCLLWHLLNKSYDRAKSVITCHMKYKKRQMCYASLTNEIAFIPLLHLKHKKQKMVYLLPNK